MGGAVSSGRDNGELVDNLKSSNYIRTPRVEAVFRAVDRGDYMLPASRDLAYKDLAWKEGQLHLSAPCIYSEVMEALELREGLTFLNVGSGTGYLSTMVGLLLGAQGVNHGIEIHQNVLTYAGKRLTEFLTTSSAVDEFDFCVPTFVQGNGLCLPPGSMRYDRVYCGAACPEEYQTYFKHLINVGGILVMPLNDSLVQVHRDSETSWSQRALLSVSFASLHTPDKDAQRPQELLMGPPSLQVMARSVIRREVQRSVLSRNPTLREPPPPRPPTGKKRSSRRICIPIEDDSDMDLNALHDIEDNESGAAEMNALLSLVLSMGQSRAAGALRIDTDSDGSDITTASDDTSRDSLYSDSSHSTLTARRTDDDTELDKNSTEDAKATEDSLSKEVKDTDTSDVQTIPLDGPRLEDATETEDNGGEKSEMVERNNEESKPGSSKPKTPETERSGDGDVDRRVRSKRSKLDSGIGEENSPEGGGEGGSPSSQSRTHEDQDEPEILMRRRLHKRSRPSSSSSSSDSDSRSVSPAPRRHKKRRATPDPHSVRRSSISQHMQCAIADLPLPPRLQLYLNLDRPLPVRLPQDA